MVIRLRDETQRINHSAKVQEVTDGQQTIHEPAAGAGERKENFGFQSRDNTATSAERQRGGSRRPRGTEASYGDEKRLDELTIF